MADLSGSISRLSKLNRHSSQIYPFKYVKKAKKEIWNKTLEFQNERILVKNYENLNPMFD
jgi:hypothetical protein